MFLPAAATPWGRSAGWLFVREFVVWELVRGGIAGQTTTSRVEAVVARADEDPRSDDDRRGERLRAEVALGDGRAISR